MKDYRTLLADYVADGSETAFRELVARYIDLVYSTAVRLVNGDTHRAEDVVQIVFADLARLAGKLSPNVMLGGWLHRRTWHVATTLMRNERRRQNRERQAMEMNELHHPPESQFEQIAPLLDEAINQLSARDRAVIVLRFFEQRDLRAVGEAFSSNGDAAQKRVTRAVEKLRCYFARRGIIASSDVISSVITAHAVHAAPVSLASSVATASLASAMSSSSSLPFSLTKIILMHKTPIITTAIIVAAIGASLLVMKGNSLPSGGQATTGGSVTTESLRHGLVLDLKFDHDETSAGKITDSSGQGNNGQATGVRWIPDRKEGGAYEFTADNEQIKIPNKDSLNPSELTLAVWIKTTYRDKKWRRIFDKSWDEGYALSVAADWKGHPCGGRAALEAATPEGHCACSTVVVADGQWHQVVATLDGNSQRVFVDGQPQGLYPLDHWINGNVNIDSDVLANDFDLVIGCNRSTPSSEHGLSFRGEIAEPMMWNRALSTNEIAFLFESQEQAPSSATNKSAP